MRLAIFSLLLSFPAMGFAGGVGTGFGEEMLVLMSARQAGTGGLALEDPWRDGTQLEANSVAMSGGYSWAGLGLQGRVFPFLRVGVDGFMFRSASVDRTGEYDDGSFREVDGKINIQEWGGRLTGQWEVWGGGAWRIAGLARASGIFQKLPDKSGAGGAVEAGGQAMYTGWGSRAITIWGMVGPLGGGGGRFSAWQVETGVGVLEKNPEGLVFNIPEGYGAGIECDILGEGLVHGGLGGVYWFGRPDSSGITVSFRGGVRLMPQSVQEVQPRGGLGVLWRWGEKWGIQFDYAYAPMGNLGSLQYATLAVRML